MDNSNNNVDLSNSSKVYALFYSFFLIPLMITIFGVLFFFLFKMLTYEKQDPYHLLNNINSGSLTKRWQSAYELSNLMSDTSKIPEDLMFLNQMVSMYKKSIHDDPRVRTYMALAMGQTGNKYFCEELINGLEDNNLENKIASIKSLGLIKCEDSIEFINKIITSNENNQIRLSAIISSGIILSQSSLIPLKNILNDEEANLRWDAAISLAKLGDDSGYNIIKKLLDRKYYTNFPEVDQNEIDQSILTILALISKLENKEFKKELENLANNEKNVKIREFAMKILYEYY